MKTVVILGGAGHIGLPLGLVIASKNIKVIALDKNESAVEEINKGAMPFLESGAQELLESVLSKGNFSATTNPAVISNADILMICIGTPIDEHLSPVPRIFVDFLEEIRPYLKNGQLLIFRSTVYPGTTRLAEEVLKGSGVDIAYCPERILQGKAVEEIQVLPTIVSAISDKALDRSVEFFSLIAPVVTSSIEEAEFAKLFLNTFRYIEFATTNQLYTIANDAGVDYSKVLDLMKFGYPRANHLPGPGLTAGPCLMKDTMQLVAYSQNNFTLGSAAFFANEGLALYIVRKIKEQRYLRGLRVGLLGMSFKANNDDIRSSLSYRVKKAFMLEGALVLCSDYLVKTDATLVSSSQAIDESELIIICTPHDQYKGLDFKGKPVVDVWNLLQAGNRIRV